MSWGPESVERCTVTSAELDPAGVAACMDVGSQRAMVKPGVMVVRDSKVLSGVVGVRGR